MKKSSFSLLVVTGLLMIATTAPASGRGKKATPPAHHATVISNITENAVTVTDEKEARTFMITQFTESNVNRQRATIADLKPGMTVDITIGMDPSRAARINASGPSVDYDHKKK